MKKLLLLPLLLVATCQAAKELTGAEVVDITAKQETLLKSYKEKNWEKFAQLLKEGVEIPTKFEEEGTLEIPPLQTMVHILNHFALIGAEAENDHYQASPAKETAALEITRIFAQKYNVTGNTRAYFSNGKTWRRTPFYHHLKWGKHDHFKKRIIAVFLAYGDSAKQAITETVACQKHDLELDSGYKQGNEKAEQAISKQCNIFQREIECFLNSTDFEELVARERLLKERGLVTESEK
jgi:hypothetical protein